MVSNITIDSTTNLYYREIESNCYDCMYSIQDMLLCDTSLVNKFKSKGVTNIVVSYIQLKGKNKFGFIYIEVHKRFRRSEQFLYIEDME